MHSDQILQLLAICAWPVVALIAGTAFVRGIRLLVEVMKSLIGCADRWRKEWWEIATYQSEVTRMQSAIVYDKKSTLETTCERALITILQANGGFPGAQGDDTTRQMVREIRKMFAEINHPTPEPEPRLREHGAGMGDEIGSPFEIVDDDDEGYVDELEDVEEGGMYGS